jgi:hypothetical protein
MNMLVAPLGGSVLTHAESIGVEIEEVGARLQIITSFEPGHGVVPVFEEGSVLIRKGEVAVYREERAFDPEPGLYCYERQRPVACSPFPDSRRIVEREVVYVRRSRLKGHEDAWEYITLKSRVINGVRRYARPEGPMNPCAAPDVLLGPVLGIYAPNSFAGEC